MIKALWLMMSLVFLVISCNETNSINSEVTKKESVETVLNSNPPSKDVVGIPGYRVECKETVLIKTLREFQCGIHDPEKGILASSHFKEFDYEILGNSAVYYEILPSTDTYYPIRFRGDFASTTQSPEAIKANTALKIRYLEKNGKADQTIHVKLDSSVTQNIEESFKYYRIYVDSVELSAFDDSSACFQHLAFREGSQWLENIVEDHISSRIGAFDVVTSASSHSEFAFHALKNDTMRWESDLDVFNNSEPYNVVNETWFQLEFTGLSPKLSGIRIFSQVSDYPQGECVPDKLRIMASSAGSEWVKLKEVTLEKPSDLELIEIIWM